MENNKLTLLTKRNISILSILLSILLLILAVIYLYLSTNKNTVSNTTTTTIVSNNDAGQENNSANLAKGQTNSDIVGFGQTFDCKPRSDEEYYRTDKTLVIDPNNPQVIYVNVEYKGFHKSTDGGKTWTLLFKGIKAYGSTEDPNKPCYSEYPYALIDPKNSDRVILATSAGGGTVKDTNALSGGIYQSLDGGKSFKLLINDDMNGYVSSITFDPNDTSTLYYGTNSSPASFLEADPNKIFVKNGIIYKLQNNVWSELPTSFNPYTGATGVHVNPNNSKEIIAFTLSAPKPQGGQRNWTGVAQMGILRSMNGGLTWSAEHTLPSGYEAVLSHDVSSTNFNNIFVSPFATEGGNSKSFYSTDNGKSFEESGKYIDYAVYDPNYSNGSRLLGYTWQASNGPVVNKLFESTDSGATWHEFASLPTEITMISDKKTLISNIVWDPVDANTFYMSGASGLVWKTNDNGKTWTKLLDYTMI